MLGFQQGVFHRDDGGLNVRGSFAIGIRCLGERLERLVADFNAPEPSRHLDDGRVIEGF